MEVQERISDENQRPMFLNGVRVTHAILVETQILLGILIKGFNRPTKQVSLDNFFGAPTEMIGDQDGTSTLKVGGVETDDDPNFAQGSDADILGETIVSLLTNLDRFESRFWV